VHNTRIERLWYDVTEGFGRKWKEFFYILELHHGLDPSKHSHIWLLHWLFLPAINSKALAWSEAWNSHKMQLSGQRRKSPRQLAIISTIADGIRGIPPGRDVSSEFDEEITDYATYGVDWEAQEDARLMHHHSLNNPEFEPVDLTNGRPRHMNEVEVEPPECPITNAEQDYLRRELEATVDIASTDMNVRRVVWVKALGLFAQLDGGTGLI
jgi:hypothetical protein